VLCEMERTLEKGQARIPTSASLFCSKDERMAVYAAVCRLLLAIEPMAARLREVCSETVSREDSFMELCEQLVKWESFPESCDKITVYRTAFEKRYEQYLKRKNGQLAFCQTTLYGFSKGMELAADMSGDGERCDPRAVIRLCEDFRTAIKEYKNRNGQFETEP